METASRCPNGVAQVQTQLSFLNMAANAVTFGLYSPMSITVQGASARMANDDQDARASLTIPSTASLADATELFNVAVQQAKDSGEGVLVRSE